MARPNPSRPEKRFTTLWSLLFLVAAAPAQTLVSDKSDYLPGETVYFAGSGFQPGEDVAMAIHVETQADKVIDYAIGGIEVDPAGEFAATWLVPGEALNSLITATALGLSSRRVAETSFTDSHFEVFLGSVSMAHDINGPDPSKVTVTVNVFSQNTVEVIAILEGGFSQEVRLFRDLFLDNKYTATVFAPCEATLEVVAVRVVVCGPFECHDQFVSPSQPATFTTQSCTPCRVNTPPNIACDDLDLGDLVGCLGEGFSKSVTVSATDFTPTVTDPDGDPVTLTFLGPSNLTLLGPGEVEATVTFTATDDPSGRQATSSCPLVPATTTKVAKVRARIVYDFEGPLAPLEPNVATLKRAGSVIPIKFRLRDCTGTAICPSNFPSIGLDANKPRLEAQAVTVLSPTGSVPVEEAGSFDCVPDQLISHEGNCGTGHWSYNLTTKNGAWTAGLTYRANIVLDDGTVHPVFFSLKK